MTLKAKLLRLLREKPRTLEELSQLTGYPVPSIKWHLIGLPVREEQHNGSTLIFLVDEVDKPRTHDGFVNRQPVLKFTFSCANSAENPPKEEIKRICGICDKVEEEAAKCPLRRYGFCRVSKVDNHDDGKLVNQNVSSKNSSTSFNSETEQSNHILTYQKSHDKTRKIKKSKQKQNCGLQSEVYNPDHGWLTKPLTIVDYDILSKVTPRQRRILQLLYVGKTQAQIARILNITRQAVYKHVKKFLRLDYIRKKGPLHGDGKKRDIIYEVRLAVVNFLKLNCQPQNKGDDSSPQRPPRYLHRLQLAYHVVNRSQPYATSTPSFVKTYSPRGWTGYIYVLGDVRIRALPYKVIAEFLEDQPFYDESAEEATLRTLEKLKKAVETWLEEQYLAGVEIELSHPYVMNTPEYILKSRKLKEWLEKLRAHRKAATLMQNGGTLDTSPVFIADDGSVWVDDSEGGNGADAEANLETNDPEKSDLVYQGIVNAVNLPSYLQPIQWEIRQIKALLTSGLSAQQRFDQLVSIVAHLLKEISILRQELAALKARGESRDAG